MSIPSDFRRLPMPANPFIDANGPLYGRMRDGQFTLGLLVETRHCNPGNMLHGGMVSTLADMTLLFVCMMQGNVNRFLVTVNMTTDFLAAAKPGDWVEGTGSVLRASKNFVFAQGLLSVQGQPIARINGIFKPTGEPIARPSMAMLLESPPTPAAG